MTGARYARLAVIPAGAFAAWTFWWLEMFVVRKGEHFALWLSEFNWSAIPICGIVAAMCAFTIRSRHDRYRPLIFVTSAALLFLSAFVVTKAAFEAFYANAMGAGFGMSFQYGPLLQLLCADLGVAILLPLLARWALGPVRLWTIWVLTLGLFLIVVASELISWSGLFNSHGELQAVRLGYPVILSAIFAPLVMHLGSTRSPPE